MKHLYIILYIIVASWIFVGCSKYEQAGQRAKEFMAANMHDGAPQSFEVVSADTTLFVTDSAALAMRQSVERSGVYKKGLDYAPLPLPRKLVYINVSYRCSGDTADKHQTFYLDENQKNIYCLKIN